jgi:hypothetical protein
MTAYDSGTKSELDNMIHDPQKDEIVLIDKLKERELVDLLVILATKAKRIQTRHWERHGYLLDMGKVLEALYRMNIHRWGLDGGKSGRDLEAFEKYFKDELFGDFHRTNELIIETLRNQQTKKKIKKLSQ